MGIARCDINGDNDVHGDHESVLSYGQERLWFLDCLDPGDPTYNVPLVYRLRGRFDVDLLQRALTAIVARHEPLRTSFSERDGKPVQVVGDAEDIVLELVDLTARDDAPERLERLAVGRATAPFDLGKGPLFRASLIRLGAADHVLCLVMHHIVADGASLAVLIGELRTLYSALGAGQPDPLPPLPIRYADFATRQRRRADDDADGLAYWKTTLAELPTLDLPADRPRPVGMLTAGDVLRRNLPGDLAAAVGRLARSQRCTAFMVLLAAYQVLLSQYSGQDDICVGSTTAGRTEVEVEPLIGMFLNTLALRGDLSGDPTFQQLLRRTRTATIGAFTHQEIPFERLTVELDLPRELTATPLFRTMLILHSEDSPGRELLPGVTAEFLDHGCHQAKFDLTLDCWHSADHLVVDFTYSTDLYDQATIDRFAQRFEQVLRAVTTDPGLPLSRLGEVGGDERARLLALAGSDVAEPGPVGTDVDDHADADADADADAGPRAPLARQFEAVAAAQPDAPAVWFRGVPTSYRELNERANRLAGLLRASGVGRDTRVAVLLERSPDLVVTLLAVGKAAGAYVPLDPAYPVDRLAYIMRDSSAALLVTTSKLAERVPSAPTALCLDAPGVADAIAGTGGPPRDPAAAPRRQDLSYVIYTSGSTGPPKGVGIPISAVAARVRWMRQRYRLTPSDRVVQFASVSFDTHVEEVWPALTAGAQLVLLPPEQDLPELLASPEAAGVTVLDLPTPYWHALVADLETVAWPPSLRLLILGADQVRSEALARWLAAFGDRVEVLNTYGPTETTVIATAAALGPDDVDRHPPIGTPIGQTRGYVLNPHQDLVPLGAAGELCIGGAGLARGYLGRCGLTASRFVPDPFGPPGSRLYRTGDRVRWNARGQLEFLGRLDDQVKIRGYRVELGEVEAGLLALPGARQAIALGMSTGRGDRELVGYVVGPDRPPARLREELTSLLPAFAIPSHIVVVDEIPLTPNGKVDRRALPAPQPQTAGTEAYSPPSGVTEQLIAGVWEQVLGVERVGATDDFFALGGHSLLATQVVARLRRAVGAGVSVVDIFTHRTLRELAALIDVPEADRDSRTLLSELTRPVPAGQRILSLVCVPYAGGTAVAYQPLADALPDGYTLYSVAIPGRDIGLDEERLPFDELVERCAAEVLDTVEGPLAIYGHCGAGGSFAVALARRLEAAGRSIDVVYTGAGFPTARPTGRIMSFLSRIARRDRLRGNRVYENWLRSMGVDTAELDPGQAESIISNMRRDALTAEEYYTRLFASPVAVRLNAPIISVIGEQDPATEFYQERYQEWQFLTDSTALVVLDEAGHFFLKYRAEELAQIVTRVHRTDEWLRDPDDGWAVLGRTTNGQAGEVQPGGGSQPVGPARPGRPTAPGAEARAAEPDLPADPAPSMRRFLLVAIGQMVSIIGSAFTEFAVPLWIYLQTGSMVKFAVFAVVGLLPGMLVAPLAGVVIDRCDRRKVMLVGDLVAGGSQAVMFGLAVTDGLEIWHIYILLATLSTALTFQRLAYTSAVPQLVPKRYLGHANGVVQMATGAGQFLVPVFAAGLMATIGLRGILLIDVVSYLFAIVVILLVRFPNTLPWRRRESMIKEIVCGWRYAVGERGLLPMLLFFAVLNVFLSPLLLLLSPLTLSFAELDSVARVSMAAGAGGVLGGLTMSFWGGPRQARTRGLLWMVLLLAACSAVPGFRASEVVVAGGAFGMAFFLMLVNGIYTTIVQVKVPQRFHGRVFAMNIVIAFSTIPLAQGVLAPLGSKLAERLMASGGGLAGSVGAVIGTGPGRGIALLFLCCAAIMALQAVISMRMPSIGQFDRRVPDSQPDDLVGAQSRRQRLVAVGRAAREE
ncbi:MAG: amino acid adenylation domain-containing protein [Dactylosporangium sp.]|nr:amino acid adenylation domain-containing protein [Dactylosporangium sp.]NNJ63438.1 amino acid adenylation domain-containing protein [Dactylosporangium sp.]